MKQLKKTYKRIFPEQTMRASQQENNYTRVTIINVTNKKKKNPCSPTKSKSRFWVSPYAKLKQ